MSDSSNKDDIRNKVIGLGENSFHKSYYPQLQVRISELEQQKSLLEETNRQLEEALNSLQEAQVSLVRNEFKYRSLFENANDVIFILDAGNLKIIDCNSKALTLFNYQDKTQLIAQNVLDLAPVLQPNGRVSETVAREVVELIYAGESQTFEWLTRTSDNRLVLCMVSLNLVEVHDEMLLQAILRDVSQLRKLEHEQGMATIRTVENERLRFAKELHDGIGPILSTIKLYLEWLEEENQNEQNKIILHKANNSIVEATKAIKEIAYNLSPHILANYGLDEAIKQFVENVSETISIEVNYEYQLEERLPADYEVLFYRVISELLNNTIKHAQANKVSIRLIKNDQSLRLFYNDDGVGFDVDKVKSSRIGMGLFNMENRINKVGGYVNFCSEPGTGVQIEFYIKDINYFNEN